MNKLIFLWALALCFWLPPLNLQGQIQNRPQGVPPDLRQEVTDLLDEASRSSKEAAPTLIPRLEEYLPILEQQEDFFLIGRSRLVLGKLLASQEDFSALREAVNQYLAAASAFEAANDLPSLATSHLLAGEGFMFFKDYSQAIQHILQALARFEVMEDSVAVMRCCQLLAESFFQTQAWIEAEKYARRSEEMARHGGLDSVLVSSLTRLGQVNHMQGRSDIAMAYLSEAHQMAKDLQFENQMAGISNLMGRISFDRNQVSRARTLHQQALKHARLRPDPIQKAHAFLGLAKSNDWGTDGAKVKPWLDSALFTGRQHDLESVVLEAYDTYASAYLDLAQVDSFRKYQSLSKDLQSDLDERAQANLIKRIGAKI
ncbi:MAG: tetratricopeptide repeat protein [Bacteroidota bacterium]